MFSGPGKFHIVGGETSFDDEGKRLFAGRRLDEGVSKVKAVRMEYSTYARYARLHMKHDDAVTVQALSASSGCKVHGYQHAYVGLVSRSDERKPCFWLLILKHLRITLFSLHRPLCKQKK